MINTSITFDDKKIKELLDSLVAPQGNNRFWYRIASLVFSKIIRNIQKGVDVDGQPFKDYTASYKRFKTRKGLSLIVNLQLKSEMIRSITIDADDKGFTIFVSGAFNNQKADWNQNKNGRVFLAWGADIQKAFDNAVRNEIKRAFGGL